MPQHHTVAVTVTTHDDHQPTPRSKAAHVASFVEAYRHICDTSESLQTAIMDMIADLMHYADLIPQDERNMWDADHDGPIGDAIVERSIEHYLAEREEARRD